MKPFQNADGGVIQSVRTYDIAPDTVVEEGQVVILSGGLVTKAAAGETGLILGVAAESHSGAADALNPRANGKEIMVFDSPTLIMRCKAPLLTATGGSATTFVCTDLAAFADNDFKGGFIRLVSKGEESTNTDAVGTVREISASAGSSKTFTINEGGTICAGDVYELYPPIGLQAGNLDTDRQGIVYSSTAELSLKVVQNSRDGYIGLMAQKHVLGNGVTTVVQQAAQAGTT